MNNLMTINNLDLDVQKNMYFTVGNNKYAIALANVLEVMKLPKLEYPQVLPSNIVGVLNFNGIIINILDVRFYLDIEVKPYTTSNNLIIAKTDESMFGIIVDAIADIVDFTSSKIERIPLSDNNKIIDALYRINNENISIINTYALEQVIKEGYPQKNVDIRGLFPTDEISVDVLTKRAIALVDKLDYDITKNVYSDNKFVSFSLNDTIYCANLKYIKEVTNNTNIIPLPCSPDYIQGLTTIRGEFITIINFKKFLNLEKTDYPEKNKIIIIDSKEFKLGFLVDDIHEISDVLEDSINTKTIRTEDKYILGEVIEENNIKILLNMEKILSDEKMYIDEY